MYVNTGYSNTFIDEDGFHSLPRQIPSKHLIDYLSYCFFVSVLILVE